MDTFLWWDQVESCGIEWNQSQAYIYVVVKNYIQVKIILTLFDSQFPLSSNPNKS